DRYWRDAGGSLFDAGGWREQRERCRATSLQALGAAKFDQEYRHGGALTVDEAVAYALGPAPSPPAQTPEPGDDVRLTRREREIVALVAEGLTNKEIAA